MNFRFRLGDKTVLDTAFAYRDDVADLEQFFQLRCPVHENAVNTANDLTALINTIDQTKSLTFTIYKRVFSRNASVVKNDVVVF